MNAVSPPPAGWYPDPSGRAPFRYWDGARWTEHTDQGTAPSPSPTAPAAPAAPSPAPMYTPPAPGYQPPAPGYAPAAPGAPMSAAAPAGGMWTAQSFIEDVKKLEGLALVVVGVIVFILASFLNWSDGSLKANGQEIGSGPANAWDGDGLWLIRGWDVNLANANTIISGGTVDSGTDMVILLPLALIVLAAAVAPKIGKKITNGNEIVAGAAVLLAGLTIAETVHLSGAIDDLVNIFDGQFIGNVQLTASGGLAFGIYIALLGTLVAAGGAVKHYLANKQTKA
ncbi:MAG: DUF2510 domain-containing protein [Ilumatobacteraceae bacterium]